DGGVERQQVGLLGDAANHVEHLADFPYVPGQLGNGAGRVGDLLHHGGDALDRVINLTTTIDRIIGRSLRRFGSRYRVARHFFNGSCHLVDRRSSLLDFVVLARQPASAFVSHSAQLFGRRCQLISRTGDLQDGVFQAGLHTRQRIEQLTGFVAAVRNNRLGQVTPGNTLRTCHCNGQRTGDHAGDHHAEHDSDQERDHYTNFQHQHGALLEFFGSDGAFLDLAIVGVDHGPHVAANLDETVCGKSIQADPGIIVIAGSHQFDDLLGARNIGWQHLLHLVTSNTFVIFQRRRPVDRKHFLGASQVIAQRLTDTLLVGLRHTTALRIQQTIQPTVVCGKAGQRLIGVADGYQIVGKGQLQRAGQAGNTGHAQAADRQRDQCTEDERREKLGRKLGLTQEVHRAYRGLNGE
ncbi:hypothetical protein Pav631_3442, partial [Pseudomonas avellanae BPIC 631]